MQRDVWAHLRAFGVGFALSVLAGCGGGFSDPADKSDDADADLIDVQVTADLDSMGEQELESKLLALGFKRVQTYGVNGRSYWTLAALPGISRPDLEGLRRLGGLAAVVQHRGRADSTGAAAAASRLNSLPVVSRTTSLSVGAAGIGGSPRPNPTGPASTPSAAHAGITIKWVYEYTGSASGQVHGCRSNPDGSLKLFDTPQDAVDACHAYLASTGSGFRFLNFRPVGNGWTLYGQVRDWTFEVEHNGRPSPKVSDFKFYVMCSGGTQDGVLLQHDAGARETTARCMLPPEMPQRTCEAGQSTPNPIIPATGEKTYRHQDIKDDAPHALNFERIYRTQWQIAPQANMALRWGHNHVANLRFDDLDRSGNTLILQLPDGSQRRFSRTSTSAWANASHGDRLTSGPVVRRAATWLYSRADDDSQWLFTQPTARSIGVPLTQRQRDGWTYSYTHNAAGRLTQVRNQFNRSLSLSYHASGLLAGVTGPDGQTTSYTWDSNARLVRVTYPGGAFLRYHYENARFPQHITGVTDENNRRYQTVTYDALGRATVSRLAGNAERYAVSYPSIDAGFNTGATITDPIGTARTYGYAQTNGRTHVTSGSALPGCKGEPPIATRTQTAQGLLESETDFHGNTTRYTWDTRRQLITSITRAAGRPEQQITAMDWHPAFSLPVRIVEPLKTTQHEYDAAGRLLRSTVTHTGGASQGKVQVTQHTYTASGLLATITEPNGAVTTFSRHNAAGLPQTITNALGHSTAIRYDAMGRPTQVTQPNGLVRTLTYSSRGWLLTSSEAVAGVRTTSTFTYRPSGQVQTVARPNGHVVTYQYDDAQRLVGWSDNRGQRASYTLDGLGNIVAEQVRDPGGAVALQIGRSINSINRLASETLGSDTRNTFSYDANGRLQSIRDASNFSTLVGLDALARINRVTNALGRVAEFTHDAQDAVTGVTDFKGVATTYQPDAQGQPVAESSPDAGSLRTTFDALNRPIGSTDALGRTTQITRDRLGRPTLVEHTQTGAPTLRTSLVYDQGNSCGVQGQPRAGAGRLCQIRQERNGVRMVTTNYRWDGQGRLREQSQVIDSALGSHSANRRVEYSYVPRGPGAGELATIRYPSGAVLSHHYDASGQLMELRWNGAPLLSDIRYNALGQPLSWRWRFAHASAGLQATRRYDSAGRLVATETGTLAYNRLGQVTALRQSEQRSNGQGGWADVTADYSAGYDPVGRLLSFGRNQAGDTQQYNYAYDANGNRQGPGWQVQTGSNRLQQHSAQVVQTDAVGQVGWQAGQALAYDAAGRLVRAKACASAGDTACAASEEGAMLHWYNGLNQRVLREDAQGSSVFVYGQHGHEVLGEYRQEGAAAVMGIEHIWLPTASGPMPVAAVINGQHHAVHADHLNTPRRLTDRSGQVRWQWSYSGFGEAAAQALAAPGQTPVHYSLRYPGQVDDGNGLFYNWHRFYDPVAGRYTQADPIGLEGGWNRFAYVGGNPMSGVDPTGLMEIHRDGNVTMHAYPGPQAGGSDKPGAPTQTLNHNGQSSQPGSECEPVPNVDEQCVSAAIRPGQSTGRWMPWNQCQSFADEVLDRCSTRPRVPFMLGLGQSWR